MSKISVIAKLTAVDGKSTELAAALGEVIRMTPVTAKGLDL